MPVVEPGSTLALSPAQKQRRDGSDPSPSLHRRSGFLIAAAAAAALVRTYNNPNTPRVRIDINILIFTACKLLFDFRIHWQPFC
jgi:hypothetical protein